MAEDAARARHVGPAQEEAAVTHVPGRDWAKAVICFVDGEPIQAVVPADLEVDLEDAVVVLTDVPGADR